MTDSQETLSLCWASLDGVSFDEFLPAAASAGFRAVTLSPATYRDAKTNGVSDKEFAQRIRDHGLRVTDIDPLFNWLPSSVTLPGTDAISVCTQASMNDVFELAHLAGADLVNAPLGLASPDSEQEIIDCFGDLCNKALAENLRVSLEFMPFNQVSNLATAKRIVTQAGCKNGGIMFDCWHHQRNGDKPDDLLSLPGEQLFAIQLDDAMAEPMDDVMEETLNHRLLPGEGCIDLVQILKNISAIGATPYYDVEIFNTPLRSLSPAQRAQKIFEATQGVMSAVEP